MINLKKKHPAGFKAKVALEALSKTKTIAEISSIYGIHSTQINRWKKQLQEGLPEIFADKRKVAQETKEGEALIADLYKQIGQLTVEKDWLKKKVEIIS